MTEQRERIPTITRGANGTYLAAIGSPADLGFGGFRPLELVWVSKQAYPTKDAALAAAKEQLTNTQEGVQL